MAIEKNSANWWQDTGSDKSTAGETGGARDVGALKWAVGTGGRTVDASLPDTTWEAPLRDLLSDDNLYATISENARVNALRLEFDLEHTLDAYARLFTTATS